MSCAAELQRCCPHPRAPAAFASFAGPCEPRFGFCGGRSGRCCRRLPAAWSCGAGPCGRWADRSCVGLMAAVRAELPPCGDFFFLAHLFCPLTRFLHVQRKYLNPPGACMTHQSYYLGFDLTLGDKPVVRLVFLHGRYNRARLEGYFRKPDSSLK